MSLILSLLAMKIDEALKLNADTFTTESLGKVMESIIVQIFTEIEPHFVESAVEELKDSIHNFIDYIAEKVAINRKK
jgi:hypothetical protein